MKTTEEKGRQNKHNSINESKNLRRVHFWYLRVDGMETLNQSERRSWWELHSAGWRKDLDVRRHIQNIPEWHYKNN
jgi:predicted DNA-binding ribbon-helix-helix protein